VDLRDEAALLLLPLLSQVRVRILPFLDPDMLFQHYEIHYGSQCVFILTEGEPDQVLAVFRVKIEHAWWDDNNTDFTDQILTELNIIVKTKWSVINHDEVCST
jgi:hypothetical protein